MVGLVLFYILGNFLMPLVSTFTINIHVWNMWIDNHIVSIFDFIKKIMASDGVILLFHLDDFCVRKEIKSCLESYNFKIHMKCAVVNFLPLTNSKDPSMKVWIQFFSHSLIFPILASTIFSHFINFSCGLWQTLLSWVTIIVKNPIESSFHLKPFFFYPLSKELWYKGVNVQDEDVFYSWIDASSMIKSKNGRPFLDG